jgi:hypothetical protein
MHLCKAALLRVNVGFTVYTTDQLLLCMLVWQSDTLGSPVLIYSRISNYGPDRVFVANCSVERLEEDNAGALTPRKAGLGSFVKSICFPLVIEQSVNMSVTIR